MDAMKTDEMKTLTFVSAYIFFNQTKIQV